MPKIIELADVSCVNSTQSIQLISVQRETKLITHDDIILEIIRVGIASAAWMLLLLSKRSPRQREQRELRWLRGGGYYLPSQMRKKRGRAGGGSGSSGDKNECVGEYGETRWAHRWGSISRRNSTKTLQKIFDVINLFQVSEISIVR